MATDAGGATLEADGTGTEDAWMDEADDSVATGTEETTEPEEAGAVGGTAVDTGGARVVTGTEATGTVLGAEGEGTEAAGTVTV